MTVLMYILVPASIGVLCFAAWVALRDLQALLHWAEEDAFTTSARRWGYIGEKRGRGARK